MNDFSTSWSNGAESLSLSDQAVEQRLAILRDELSATENPETKAALGYEIASILEKRLGNDAEAVRAYLDAYNSDPTFRPNLFALTRIFGRRKSSKNLLRLFEAEARSARNSTERASALVDAAWVLHSQTERKEQALAMLEEAAQANTEDLVSVVLLEDYANPSDESKHWFEERISRTQDEQFRSLLVMEAAALQHIDGNDIRKTLDELTHATSGLNRWRALQLAEYIARTQNHFDVATDCLRARISPDEFQIDDEEETISSAPGYSRPAFGERQKKHSAALLRESARIYLNRLDNPEQAIRAYEEALQLDPTSVLLKMEYTIASELAGHPEKTAQQASELLQLRPPATIAASLHFRLAESARIQQNPDELKKHLQAALQHAPQSPVVQTMLDDAVANYDKPTQQIEWLRNKQIDGKPNAEALWQAAEIAWRDQNNLSLANSLYRAAAAASEDSTPIVRELWGALLMGGEFRAAGLVGQELLNLPLDDEERSSVLRDLHELYRNVLDDEQSADEILSMAIRTPAAQRWSVDAGKVHAAMLGKPLILAEAHQVQAQLANDVHLAAAHHCAAGRAFVLGQKADHAIAELRKAIEIVSGHPYAISLLEETLRATGKSNELVTFLKELAAGRTEARTVVDSLLAMGAAAEIDGQHELAKRTYALVLEKGANPRRAHHALLRIGEHTNDIDLIRASLEGLIATESEEFKPGLRLRLAEFLEGKFNDHENAQQTLAALLEDPQLKTYAAIRTLLAPLSSTANTHVQQATQVLAETLPYDNAIFIQEALAAAMLDRSKSDEEIASSLKELVMQRPDDVWAHYHLLRFLSGQPNELAERAETWVSMAHATDDPIVAGEFVLHALRTKILSNTADGHSDAVILAHEISETDTPDCYVAAIAEAVSDTDDPDSRADALSVLAQRSSTETASVWRASYGRALVHAGRHDEALRTLRATLEINPRDLAGWEAFRISAWKEGAWNDFVQACDELAEHCGGNARAELLEEAGVALVTYLGNYEEADKRFRESLAIDPMRAVSYSYRYELLDTRDDTEGLLQMVSARIKLVHEPAELEKLLYEQALLLRATGELEGSKGAVDELLLLDPDHVGALALCAEIASHEERWREAVDSFRRIAASDVPSDQHRIARLAAANLLENQLQDPSEAFDELQALNPLAEKDHELLLRMAEIAKRAKRNQEAVQCLYQAVSLVEPEKKAAVYRDIGNIELNLNRNENAARIAYETAMRFDATDSESCGALIRLSADAGSRVAILNNFDSTVMQGLHSDPGNEMLYRKLCDSAFWSGDRTRHRRILEVMLLLGLTNAEDRAAMDSTNPASTGSVKEPIATHSLQMIRSPVETDIDLSSFAQGVSNVLSKIHKTKLDSLGIKKADRIKDKTPCVERDELRDLCEAFGLPLGEVYVGGDNPDATIAIPRPGDVPDWVIGFDVQAPLPKELRFQIARHCMAARLGLVSLVSLGLQESYQLLQHAAAQVSPLVTMDSQPPASNLLRKFSRNVNNKTRKALLASLEGAEKNNPDFDEYISGVFQSTVRAGVLIANELNYGLRFWMGDKLTPEYILKSKDAIELILFWVSREALQVQRQAGILRSANL